MEISRLSRRVKTTEMLTARPGWRGFVHRQKAAPCRPLRRLRLFPASPAAACWGDKFRRLASWGQLRRTKSQLPKTSSRRERNLISPARKCWGSEWQKEESRKGRHAHALTPRTDGVHRKPHLIYEAERPIPVRSSTSDDASWLRI